MIEKTRRGKGSFRVHRKDKLATFDPGERQTDRQTNAKPEKNNPSKRKDRSGVKEKDFHNTLSARTKQ